MSYVSFPTIPSTIGGWSIDVLEKLLEYRDIESDIFDFKGEPDNLDVHLCAMANSGGGTLVLGIDEEKANDHLIKFKKRGFDTGEENAVENKIGNHIFHLEPTPKVEVKHLYDANGKFYTVLKVITEESKKPYMLRDRCQFYVRINASSRPASRATIFNLFTNTSQKRSEIERLRVTVDQFKEAILFTTRDIAERDYGPTSRITPIDLSFIRSAAISAEWFLRENRLLGKTEKNGYEFGLYQIMHRIASLNVDIDAFNSEIGSVDKEQFWRWMRRTWMPDGNDTKMVEEFLDKIIAKCEEFLSKY